MADLPALPVMLGAISERQFQAQIVGLAELRGWLVYHTWNSRHSTAGFPDLVLVREYVIFAEIKTEKGKLTAEQEAWIEAIQKAQNYNLRAYVWKPSDWEQIVRVLE